MSSKVLRRVQNRINKVEEPIDDKIQFNFEPDSCGAGQMDSVVLSPRYQSNGFNTDVKSINRRATNIKKINPPTPSKVKSIKSTETNNRNDQGVFIPNPSINSLEIKSDSANSSEEVNQNYLSGALVNAKNAKLDQLEEEVWPLSATIASIKRNPIQQLAQSISPYADQSVVNKNKFGYVDLGPIGLQGRDIPVTVPHYRLLILDIDYILLERVHSKNGNTPEGAYRRGEYVYWIRPHLQKFLDYIFANFEVAIWTVSEVSSIKPILKDILGKYYKKLVLILDHEYCQTVDSYEETEYIYDAKGRRYESQCSGVVKNLEIIWQWDSNYSAANTLIMDVSRSRIMYNKQECVCSPPVWDRTLPEDYALSAHGHIFKQIKDYIKDTQKVCQFLLQQDVNYRKPLEFVKHPVGESYQII